MEKEILGYKVKINDLKEINNGFNFGNVEKKEETKSKYFIEVMLDTRMNLKDKSEKLEVRHNLFSNYSYHYGQDVSDFFKELEELAKKPIAEVRHFNRKNEISTWGLSFRDTTIKFADVKISIGELAGKKLKELKIDFIKRVKEILNLQKKDKTAQDLLDKFVFLKEKILTLDECVGKKKERWGCYSYNKKEDETLKMALLSPIQYNERLKEIEIEMREIAGKLGINIRDDFQYIEIPKKVEFDEWFKVNKYDLEESWAMFDEDEKSEYKNLKGYGKMVYDETGGEIVALDGSNEEFDEEDFDEEE